MWTTVRSSLEDHAYLADGLLVLYQTTFDVRSLDKACALADNMLTRFWDSEASSTFTFDVGGGMILYL